MKINITFLKIHFSSDFSIYRNRNVLKHLKLYFRKLFTFSSSSPEPLGQFQPYLARSRVQVCSNEDPRPFPMGDCYELAKIHWQNFKKSSSQEPLDQFQPNERPSPFPRGDNYEIAKIHCQNLKIFFSRTTGPISTKLDTMHPWVI